MKLKKDDIKVGHIYYANFEPTRRGEFDKNHLALILKKNANNITFIVIPLTSSDEGDNVNKINIGKINSLPPHLQGKDSYAVYDQIRTLNYTRFSKLHEGNVEYDAYVSDETVKTLISKIINNLISDMESSDKDEILEKSK